MSSKLVIVEEEDTNNLNLIFNENLIKYEDSLKKTLKIGLLFKTFKYFETK